MEINGTLGLKTASLLLINYDSELYKESTYVGNNMTLQLFTDQPETIIFPQGFDTPFTLFPKTQAKSKFILPKKKIKSSLKKN